MILNKDLGPAVLIKSLHHKKIQWRTDLINYSSATRENNVIFHDMLLLVNM